MIIIERTMNGAAVQSIESLPLLLFEGEVNAHKFIITPTSGVSFAGCDVTARFVRADHTNVAVAGTLDQAGRAIVVLTGGCYEAPGNYKFFIYVVDDTTGSEKTVCIYACAGSVVQTIGENGTAPASQTIIESYPPTPLNIADGAGTGAAVANDMTGNSAVGTNSFAIGTGTIAEHLSQFIFGQYNRPDSYNGNQDGPDELGYWLEIVGNGTSDSSRSNARTLDMNGTEWLGGSLVIGGNTLSPAIIQPAKMNKVLGLIDHFESTEHVSDDQYDFLLDNIENILLQYTKDDYKLYQATINIYHLWMLTYAKQLLEAFRISGLNVYQVMDRIVNMAENWTGGSFGDNSGNYGTDHGVTQPDYVVPDPVIIAQPKDRTVNAGALTVMDADIDYATSYQWQYSQDGGTTWTDCGSGYIGAKSIRVLFSATAAMNGYKFRLNASNDQGSVTTNAATLTVVST